MQSDNKDQKKRVIIGDVHCNGGWMNIVNKHADADEFIFVGDYLDPYSKFDKYDRDCEFGVLNFKQIVKFKRKNPDKVTLLLGNHDFHYLKAAQGENCSRYDDYFWNHCNSIFEELVENNEIQIVKQFCNVLVSHAGISPAWFNYHIGEMMQKCSFEEIANKVNNHFKSNPRSFGFYMMDSSYYGEDPMQSPIWIRPDSLTFAMTSITLPKLVTQVVGHTSTKAIKDAGFKHSLWMVDNQKYDYKGLVFKGKNPQI